jgi:type I restriction enzyme S subunit
MGWPKHLLESLCIEFTDGNWVESKDQSPEGVRLIQTGNVGEGVFKGRDDKARYISEATFSRLKCFEIFEGDCLISRLPEPVGRSCVLPDTGERMITAVDCTVVRFDTKKILPSFFNYYSQSRVYLNDIDEQTSGATRKRISRKNLGKIRIPLPPIPEQKRIVAILDKAFADIDQARALTEQNLKNARELFESYLQQVFSQRGEEWVDGYLENLVSEDCSLSYGIVQPGDDFPDGLPVVRPTDLTRETIEVEGLKRINPSNGAGYSRTVLQGGELLVCVRGSTGTTSVASEELAGANVTRGIVPVRLNPEKVLQRFGYYQFASPSIQTQIQAGTYGAALMQINIRDFKKIKMLVPPLSIQKTIVDKLDDVKPDLVRVEEIYAIKILAFDELKKSLLQKAFSGELTRSSEAA